jgi:sulfotransferase family protein
MKTGNAYQLLPEAGFPPESLISRIARWAPQVPGLAMQFVTSYLRSIRNRDLFKDIQACCLFIGYPRSGHTLVGSLLDAHPNVIIANELDMLKYLHLRFGKKQIYHLLLKNSERLRKVGRATPSYPYIVHDQWQGRIQKLTVIGDKHGEATTLRLRYAPDLLPRLTRTLNTAVKFIHVVRNPYDNISTILTKAENTGWTMDQSIDYYSLLCETVDRVKRQVPAKDFFELTQEMFIENPKGLMIQLCDFLGIEADQGYLADCASIVFVAPHQTRYQQSWNRAQIHRVENLTLKYPFLEGYSFDPPTD